MRMRLAISCDPLEQFDDSIEFQSNFNLQVSLAQFLNFLSGKEYVKN